MTLHAFSRSELILGTNPLNKLRNSTVAIFGIGGVGTFATEALARTAVGKLVLIDNDDISLTNINRQIHATYSTIGEPKVEVMKKRILDINPEAEVITFRQLYNEVTAEKLLNYKYDYVVDAIDMVSAKIDLIERCKMKGIPIISSMGAGNKLNPTEFIVDDIYNTSVCPLARVLRKELKKRNIKDLKVVYSKEKPVKGSQLEHGCINQDCSIAQTTGHQIPGSIAFVPSVAGLIIASVVIKDLLQWE